jgi:hypothetical protein
VSAPHKQKVYLGDGAYVQWDGNGLMLTAENGIVATDTVYLEVEVISSFLRYLKQQVPDATVWRTKEGT